MSFGWGAPRFGLTVNSRIWLATRFNIEIEKFNQEMRQMLLSLNPVFLMPGKDYEQRNGAVISPANTIILDNMECYMQETGIVVSTNGLFTDPSQPILKRRQCSNLKGGKYFQIVVLEKTLESPLNCKEIRPGHPKENQP